MAPASSPQHIVKKEIGTVLWLFAGKKLCCFFIFSPFFLSFLCFAVRALFAVAVKHVIKWNEMQMCKHFLLFWRCARFFYAYDQTAFATFTVCSCFGRKDLFCSWYTILINLCVISPAFSKYVATAFGVFYFTQPMIEAHCASADFYESVENVKICDACDVRLICVVFLPSIFHFQVFNGVCICAKSALYCSHFTSSVFACILWHPIALLWLRGRGTWFENDLKYLCDWCWCYGLHKLLKHVVCTPFVFEVCDDRLNERSLYGKKKE